MAVLHLRIYLYIYSVRHSDGKSAITRCIEEEFEKSSI